MTARSEHSEKEEAKPNHVDHSLEKIGNNTGHNWIQRGIEMVCDGNHDHYQHGFTVNPELVFVSETEDGLKFRNVKTGEEVVKNFV